MELARAGRLDATLPRPHRGFEGRSVVGVWGRGRPRPWHQADWSPGSPYGPRLAILSEAQARLASALALAKSIACDDLLKAKLACALGWSLFYARKLPNEAEVAWLDAILFARCAGNIEYQQRALVGFAFYLLQIGHVPRAITYLEEATELGDRERDLTATSEADRALAWARAFAGELSKSRTVLDRLAATLPCPRDVRARMPTKSIASSPSASIYPSSRGCKGRLIMRRGSPAPPSMPPIAAVNGCRNRTRSLAALPVSLETGNLAALESYAERLRRNLRAGAHLALGPSRTLFLRLPARPARR